MNKIVSGNFGGLEVDRMSVGSDPLPLFDRNADHRNIRPDFECLCGITSSSREDSIAAYMEPIAQVSQRDKWFHSGKASRKGVESGQ